MMNLAGRLREMAVRCREVTRPRSDGIVTELEGLARDYEKDAARLEAAASDQVNTLFQWVGDVGKPPRPGHLVHGPDQVLPRIEVPMAGLTTMLIIAGVALVLAGVAGFGIPEFTTSQTREVARIGDLNIQTQERMFHVIPPVLAGGALVLGIVLIGGGLFRRR